MATESAPFVYAVKSSFSAGELTPTIEGRSELPLYPHGAKKIINWMLLPSGGLMRRPGTEFVWATLPEKESREDLLFAKNLSIPVPTSQDQRSKGFREKRKVNPDEMFFDPAVLIKDEQACKIERESPKKKRELIGSAKKKVSEFNK